MSKPTHCKCYALAARYHDGEHLATCPAHDPATCEMCRTTSRQDAQARAHRTAAWRVGPADTGSEGR